MRRKIKRNNFSSIIKTHIYNNFKEYLSISLVLIIGIVIGVITINNSNEEQVNEISTYINNFLGDLKEVSNIDTGALLINTFFNNLYLILILWFVGSTVIGIPIVYGIIGYKGFCLGYTISSSIITLGTAKGTCFSLASMLLQNIIYIPCILALAVSGIRLYKSIMKDRRKENIKLEVIKHTAFSAFIGIFILIGVLVETYVSTYLIKLFINSL